MAHSFNIKKLVKSNAFNSVLYFIEWTPGLRDFARQQ